MAEIQENLESPAGKAQWRWASFLASREEQVFLVLTLAIGALVGATVVAFILLTQHFAAQIYAAHGGSPWRRLLIPVVSSLAMGYLLYRFFPDARGSGVPQTKAALYARDGHISLKTVFGKFFCTSATLASGIPLGREGPSVQVGAGLASFLGRKLGLRQEKIKALIPVGAAAAVAAAFNTPLAAVLFALEEVVGDLHAPVLGSVVLASATSWAMLRILLGNDPLFKVPEYQLVHPLELLAYATLGVAGGLVSAAFSHLLLWLRKRFLQFPRKTCWFQPVAGGLVVGAMGWFVPQILGVGYLHVGEALNGGLALRFMLLLLVLKFFAVVVSYSSGNAGGIFGPSLFLGAMLGGVVGTGAHMILPAYVGKPGAYALVGMGTAFAGIVRAPMTSVVMIFEITRDYAVIVPLMISNLLSFFIAARLQRKPIYDELARQDGIHLPGEEQPTSAGQIKVAAILRPATESFAPELSVREALEILLRQNYRTGLVVTSFGVEGVVNVEMLRSAQEKNPASKLMDMLPAGEFAHLHLDHTIAQALDRMGASRMDMLPVVSRANIKKLEGIVTLRDVLERFGVSPKS
ncbi:MAG: chloride channel protein [Acidobacteria bacterium]|nr:chloride channel protein [Acidobacteriota bacterium]MBS1865067.1 chloride channel protein [Acidobacteriota bacterium]